MELKQKKNPYPHGNVAETNDYLEELILVSSGEKGSDSIDETENGYEEIIVDHTQSKSLTLPDGAISAFITVSADETTNNNETVIRIKDNGAEPTNVSGLGVGNIDDIEVTGRNSLENFKAIGIEIGKSHTLRVQYSKSNQEV
ncbi:MAG: hypothetical protein JKY51_04820 [Opitutaceae bacterium]|nr:hypothetical protein [Opitutaceae bacterium]